MCMVLKSFMYECANHNCLCTHCSIHVIYRLFAHPNTVNFKRTLKCVLHFKPAVRATCLLAVCSFIHSYRSSIYRPFKKNTQRHSRLQGGYVGLKERVHTFSCGAKGTFKVLAFLDQILVDPVLRPVPLEEL